ncbi:MAG TPA: BatD family protein, partial [Pontiella sp.]|nr:BatD family protein [Pontiella sp.]
LGPVTADFKGGSKTLTTKLRVIKPQDDPEAQQISQIMFSRIATDRDTPYVHEPFNLELNVFIRDGAQIDGQFGIRGGMPESGLDGELKWEVVDRKREDRNGTIFTVYTLSTTAKALTAGTFTFRPEVQLNVVIPRQQRRSWGFDDPFFGDFFGRQETRPIALDCNRLDVDVLPVPMESRPDSYTGGVGELGFDVSVGPTQVKAGEPVTIKMRIHGKGNLEKIIPPGISEHHDIKLYDARSIPAKTPDEVCFEQVVIPKSDSISEIPAISFSYFNTKTADFRTITRGPFPITVEGVPQNAAQVIATVPSTIRQETKVLGRDIAYLKQRPGTWRMNDDTIWYRTGAFRILIALPLAVLMILSIVVARRNVLNNNVALARRQKAPRTARRNIQLAARAMRAKDENAFQQAMWDALTEYFGHRLNLAPGEVTLQTVLARIPGEPADIEHLFNQIEQWRYAIRSHEGNPKDEMKALLRKLSSVLKRCERMKL